jgi:hypothetical protein
MDPNDTDDAGEKAVVAQEAHANLDNEPASIDFVTLGMFIIGEDL